MVVLDARTVLNQLNSRKLSQMRRPFLVDQLKKELRKTPVINFHLAMSIRGSANLPEIEKVGLYRMELYKKMTLQQYDLFKDLVDWMRGNPSVIKDVSSCLSHLKGEENYQFLEFVLKHPNCLPTTVERNVAEEKMPTATDIYKNCFEDKCARARHIYDQCIQELKRGHRKVKGEREEMTPPEVTAPDSSVRESTENIVEHPVPKKRKVVPIQYLPFEVIDDEVIRRETLCWHAASIEQRTKYFEEKNRVSQKNN